MAQDRSSDAEELRILHCFRSPVGGIFRHVRDLIHQQAAQGHAVGVICDSNTGGAYEDKLLEELEPYLELGLFRIDMDRAIGPRDVSVIWKLFQKIRPLNTDILHSHGAKGGAYARFIGTLLRRGRKRPVRIYCPHGGSVHFDQGRFSGKIYFQLERLMERFTDRLVFVSEYERDSYFAKIGEAHCPHSLIYNGLTEQEFLPVAANKDAADFLYVGMMRDLKGVDLLLDALPQVAKRINRTVSIHMVGDGPDLETYKSRAAKFDDSVDIQFHDPMPVRQAFALGETLIVPSRAESMPYVVLEALAAKRPVLATRVGGIPEIFAINAGALIEPDSADALAHAMTGHLQKSIKGPDFDAMHASVKQRFSVDAMTDAVMQAYRDSLNA